MIVKHIYYGHGHWAPDVLHANAPVAASALLQARQRCLVRLMSGDQL